MHQKQNNRNADSADLSGFLKLFTDLFLIMFSSKTADI